MKKYYMRLFASIEVTFLFSLMIISWLLIAFIKGRDDFKMFISFFCFSFMWLFFYLIVLRELYDYVYIKDNKLVYKTIFKCKEINLLDNIEFSIIEKNYTAVIIGRIPNTLTKIIVIKSPSTTIEIPIDIYIKIQKDYPILPEIEKIDSKNDNKYNEY